MKFLHMTAHLIAELCNWEGYFLSSAPESVPHSSLVQAILEQLLKVFVLRKTN